MKKVLTKNQPNPIIFYPIPQNYTNDGEQDSHPDVSFLSHNKYLIF